MKKFNVLILMSVFWFFSCENNSEINPKPEVSSYQKYKAFQSSVLTDLNMVGAIARKSKGVLSEESTLEKINQLIYGADASKQDAFHSWFNRSTKSSRLRAGELSTFQAGVKTELQNALEASTSPKEYIKYLDKKMLDYSNDTELSSEDQNFALYYVASMGAYFQFVENNRDLLPQTGSLGNGRTTTGDDNNDGGESSWWESVKCPLGSALVGAAAGVAAVGIEIGTLGAGTPVAVGIVVAAGTWMIEC